MGLRWKWSYRGDFFRTATSFFGPLVFWLFVGGIDDRGRSFTRELFPSMRRFDWYRFYQQMRQNPPEALYSQITGLEGLPTSLLMCCCVDVYYIPLSASDAFNTSKYSKLWFMKNLLESSRWFEVFSQWEVVKRLSYGRDRPWTAFSPLHWHTTAVWWQNIENNYNNFCFSRSTDCELI